MARLLSRVEPGDSKEQAATQHLRPSSLTSILLVLFLVETPTPSRELRFIRLMELCQYNELTSGPHAGWFQQWCDVAVSECGGNVFLDGSSATTEFLLEEVEAQVRSGNNHVGQQTFVAAARPPQI